jgi:hypothetical protein
MANLVSGIVDLETNGILMLLLRKEEQTSPQLTRRFVEATGNLWKTGSPQNIVARAIDTTMVPTGFAVKYKNHCVARYSLGSKGARYGQAIALLALEKERQSGMSMCCVFGKANTGDGNSSELNRFKILERLSRGPARINELSEITNVLRRVQIKNHINALKGLGLVEYLPSENGLYSYPEPKNTGGNGDASAAWLAGEAFGRMRVRFTDKGRAFSDNFIEKISETIRTGQPDPHISALLKFYTEDMERLRLLAINAIRLYLAACPYKRLESERANHAQNMAERHEPAAAEAPAMAA